MKRTFILKLKNIDSDWQEPLLKALNDFCIEMDISASIFELDSLGEEKAEAILNAE